MINDVDNIVLQGALHHVERVTPTGHHLARTDSSALATTKAPTSRPHSSCTTSLPQTTLPPTASSTETQPPIAGCASTTEEESSDELPLLKTGGLAASSTATTGSVLTPRAVSPDTNRPAGNRHYGTTTGSRTAASNILNLVLFSSI